MDIFVEDKKLKCAPFGRKTALEHDVEDYDKLVLTYGEIDPLSTVEWQHITCILVNDVFVKGQYLKINMTEIDESYDFPVRILRPSTFAKSIKDLSDKLTKPLEYSNANLVEQRRWTVVLGSQDGKYFAGSFKDVRLWKTARTDAQLYNKRFNQINQDADLAGNLKFMNGNPQIFNSADTDVDGKEFSTIEPRMILAATD